MTLYKSKEPGNEANEHQQNNIISLLANYYFKGLRYSLTQPSKEG